MSRYDRFGEPVDDDTAPTTLQRAEAELADCRERVEHIRQLVAEQKVPASALCTAEYSLNLALKRVQKLCNNATTTERN